MKRIPIVTDGVKYQTIASMNDHYEPCVVMGTYPDIETARDNYTEDINEIKRTTGGYRHYAIRKVETLEG